MVISDAAVCDQLRVANEVCDCCGIRSETVVCDQFKVVSDRVHGREVIRDDREGGHLSG